MRIGQQQSVDEPQIELVPLIDVVLVLIIFFVITSTFETRSTMQLQLPKASDQATPLPAKSLTILINANGRYFINDQEAVQTDVESLKRSIAQVAGSERHQPVLLRADARTPYQSVITAQDALGQLGFARIAIATVTPQADGGARGP